MRCTVKSCANQRRNPHPYCNEHYLRWTRYGRLQSVKRAYGTGGQRPDGYWTISVDGRRYLLHRVIMERHLGKPLKPGAIVHHLNGDPSDNRISNLVVTTQREHAKHHRWGHGLLRLPAWWRKKLSASYRHELHSRDRVTGRYVRAPDSQRSTSPRQARPSSPRPRHRSSRSHGS